MMLEPTIEHRSTDLEKLKDDEEAANDIAEEEAAAAAEREPDPVMKRTAPDPNYRDMPTKTPQGTPVWTSISRDQNPEGVKTTPEMYMSEKEIALQQQMAKLKAMYTSMGVPDTPEWMNRC